jgi:hypothetical protein
MILHSRFYDSPCLYRFNFPDAYNYARAQFPQLVTVLRVLPVCSPHNFYKACCFYITVLVENFVEVTHTNMFGSIQKALTCKHVSGTNNDNDSLDGLKTVKNNNDEPANTLTHITASIM